MAASGPTLAEPHPPGAVAGAQSIRRAIDVLRFVAGGGEAGRRLTEVAQALGLHTATAHRLLSTLAEEGFLLRHAENKGYRIGAEVISLAAVADRQFALRDLFMPALEAIARFCEDTVFLQVRSGDETVCLARVAGSHPIQTSLLDVGTRRPLAAGAAGLSMLAYLPGEEAAAILRRTEPLLARFGGDSKAIRAALARARKLGYAANPGLVAGENVHSIGVAFTDGLGMVAAISVSAQSRRMTPNRRVEIVETVRKAGGSLARIKPYPPTLPQTPRQHADKDGPWPP